LPFNFTPPAPPTAPTAPSASPVPTPPATSNCTSTMQPPQAGAAPQQSTSQMLQSSAGQTRIDTPDTSIITDPKAAKTIILNHLTQEATVIPMPAAPTAPGLPGAPSFSPPGLPGVAPPSVSPTQVVDLGKAVINGQAATGKQFTFPAPSPPSLPGAPSIPGAPALPGAPQAPGGPAPPSIPAAPHTVMEVWSSASLLLPVLTKVTGPFGQQITQCQVAPAAEPPPAKFQIPPGYKLTPPPIPPPPALPQ
jgi:hypothetical protein